MDLDASLKKHGSRLDEIEKFVELVKGLMGGADDHVDKAADQLDEILAFKSMVEGLLPMIEKAVMDVGAVAADLAAIKQELAPALAWIAEQQKAGEALTESPAHEPPAPEAEQADPEQPAG